MGQSPTLPAKRRPSSASTTNRPSCRLARASTDAGSSPCGIDSADPVISADGTHIAFDSVAGNIWSSDTNGVSDVFELARGDSWINRISEDSNFQQADGPSWGPSISADGSKVAFTSDADNLNLRPDTNQASDVFLHDGAWGTFMVSRSFDGGMTYLSSAPTGTGAEGGGIIDAATFPAVFNTNQVGNVVTPPL